jgi:nicotinamidase-related amidase
MPTRSRFPHARTAVLLVDVINPFDFTGGPAFARRARQPAQAIADLRTRATDAGLPVIYVNDNLGRWRSDVDALVHVCCRKGMPGAPIVELLAPRPIDYVVLKSTLSGFHQSALDALLRASGAHTLIITGFAADNCVLFTAADAYMRDYRVLVPSDCVAARSAAATARALATMSDLLKADCRPSSALRLHGRK